MADVAGISYHLEMGSKSTGLEVRCEGLSEKLPRLLLLIFDMLTTRVADMPASDFARVHEQISRRFRNLSLKPAKQAHSIRLFALRPDAIPVHVRALSHPDSFAAQ